MASRRRNLNSPWMDLVWTVAIRCAFDDEFQKQSKKKLNEDWINKNFRIPWRIGRV